MAATVAWEIHGVQFTNCNCNYACPCQFGGNPDKGHCEAIGAYGIDRGHFGDLQLDGLRAIGIFKWPGPIHEGNGAMQLVIDERADARQREALVKILSGHDTDEMATMWFVFGAMSPTKHPPLFRRIDLEVDIEARRARIDVPGVATMRGEPIRDVASGAEHRVRIDFPKSFEFRQAEIGSGVSHTTGPVAFDLKDSYGQFAPVHLSNKGRLD